MNSYCELSSNKFILLQFVIIIHLTQSQNTSESNITNQPSTTKDSNITWIKITTINPTPTTTISLNYSNIENISIEDPSSDFSSSSRRKRRKRRRNKYRSWNQRRTPEHSHKKHSTRVHLDKPVQFLIPPDYQENLIPKESEFIKPRYENVNSGTKQNKEKSVTPPARYLLPPFVDQYFLGNSVTTDTEKKPSKSVEWSANANRGATKFKHTIYYSDSGNEILSHEIRSTTAAAIQTTARSEPPRKPEYRPIVVQPMPIQYTTQAFFVNNSNYETSNAKEKRVNYLVSSEVANAGMQVINMSAYQPSQQLSQQKQYKQYTEPPTTQSTPTTINHRPFQQNQPPFVNSEVVFKNSQNEHLRQMQTFNQQYKQPNYYPSTSYAVPSSDTRSTTPATEFTTNRTIIARTESTTTDNFKGLEIAESKYFSDIPSEQEFSALQNDQVIPGIAGKDYPVFGQTLLQKRRFACRGLEGYFADVTSRCQVFYICNGDGAGEPMLCPNGTLFSQELLVCDWWYNVNC